MCDASAQVFVAKYNFIMALVLPFLPVLWKALPLTKLLS
jgi:hypothetical protein